jgi:hypothetical protein
VIGCDAVASTTCFAREQQGAGLRVGLRRGRERPTPLIEVRGAMRAYSPDP